MSLNRVVKGFRSVSSFRVTTTMALGILCTFLLVIKVQSLNIMSRRGSTATVNGVTRLYDKMLVRYSSSAYDSEVSEQKFSKASPRPTYSGPED